MSTRKIRVLIADDEPLLRQLITQFLRNLDADVVGSASDGEEAVKLFEQLRPDMVLLDINMPKLTGDAALKRIMQLDPDAFVIMLTAQNLLDTVEHCLDLGARNFILKNVPADQLYVLVAETWNAFLQQREHS